jgi:hypothetical protein
MFERARISLLFGSLAVVLAVAEAPRAKAAPSGGDPKAVAIADKVMTALGGQKAWEGTRFLRFDFAVDREGKAIVSRAHTWDKWTGRYRLEGLTKEGDPYVVLMNLNTKEGDAWRKGKKLAGEERKKELEDAFAVWTNDTYWLLMPYKLHDAGCKLALAGEEKKGGKAWDKLFLTFDNVGLTPKDKYWVYVNRETGLVDKWDFVLKGENKPPSTFTWEGWKSYGKIQLANDHVSAKDKVRIHHPVLDTPAVVADAVFTTP